MYAGQMFFTSPSLASVLGEASVSRKDKPNPHSKDRSEDEGPRIASIQLTVKDLLQHQNTEFRSKQVLYHVRLWYSDSQLYSCQTRILKYKLCSSQSGKQNRNICSD